MVTSASGAPRALTTAMDNDLRFADVLMARALTKSSWLRNKAWAQRFLRYVKQNCGRAIAIDGLRKVVQSTRVSIAFLARVAHDSAGATTRVDAAKRAINFLRSLVGANSLDCNPLVRLLAKAARNATVRTVRQSPAMPMPFVKAVISTWGNHPEWWCRQVALMILLGVCTLARGAELVSCRRFGVAWVKSDGSQVRTINFVPPPGMLKHFSGVLLLFPSRKNKQAVPTWIPVVSRVALRFLAAHLRWLDGIRRSRTGPPGTDQRLFPARRSRRQGGVRVYQPAIPPSAGMSVDSFRLLLRQALVACCRISATQAKEFGTHSLRIAAVELLRAKGVPASMRQQLGGWMSSASALRYLQLPVNAQFAILRRIFN